MWCLERKSVRFLNFKSTKSKSLDETLQLYHNLQLFNLRRTDPFFRRRRLTGVFFIPKRYNLLTEVGKVEKNEKSV